MEDDSEKIKIILDELNKDLSEPEWEEVEGYQALTSVRSDGSNVNFDPSSGVVVKAFINHRTYEIKTYYYRGTVKE